MALLTLALERTRMVFFLWHSDSSIGISGLAIPFRNNCEYVDPPILEAIKIFEEIVRATFIRQDKIE